MSSTATPRPTLQRELTARPLRCRNCGADRAAAPVSICDQCLGPLDAVYDPARPLPDANAIAARAPSLWRYREWLPFQGEPVHSLDSGFTPLVAAPALARRLGVARAWVKNDTVCHPSLSFKDRVVAAAINAAAAFDLNTIGCASTGNLANAVAAHAARAGLVAWVFIPEELEAGKVLGTSIYGPKLVRVRGTYDDVNRLCAQVADRFGWGIVNVNLRGYYGEGSKTVAYEIAEQLGWRLPTAVVAPMAGGSLSIGNPADGAFAARAIAESGGWAAAVSDAELIEGIQWLAQDVGVFAETAGGVTAAAALALAQAGRLRPDDEVVLCITGHGLKTLEAVTGVLPEAPVIAPRLREVASLVERSS